MSPSRRPGTTDPHRSRERALKVLYQADLRNTPPVEWLASVIDDERASALLDDVDDPDQVANLATRVEEARMRGTSDIDGYARALVVGVGDHLEELDDMIEGYAERWTLARMAAIDRNVLRLAAYELLHEDTPPAVVMDEALVLVRELSTDNSVRFVNGILEAIRRGPSAAERAAERDAAAAVVAARARELASDEFASEEFVYDELSSEEFDSEESDESEQSDDVVEADVAEAAEEPADEGYRQVGFDLTEDQMPHATGA